MDSILILFLVSLMINLTLALPDGKLQNFKNPIFDGDKLDNVQVDQEMVETNVHHSPAISVNSRTSLEEPQESKCSPTPIIVSLRHPTLSVEPKCFRVIRCGGDCNNELHSCQPTSTRRITYSKFEQCSKTGGHIMENSTADVEHLSCGCGCKQKPSDCQFYQHFDAENCKCVCNDYAPKNDCEDAGKIWNESTCSCKCLDLYSKKHCNNLRKIWDEDTCSCKCPDEEYKKSDCAARSKTWNEDTCSCPCPESSAKNDCELLGKHWYDYGCVCGCPINTIRICPTGYYFDSDTTCTCVVNPDIIIQESNRKG